MYSIFHNNLIDPVRIHQQPNQENLSNLFKLYNAPVYDLNNQFNQFSNPMSSLNYSSIGLQPITSKNYMANNLGMNEDHQKVSNAVKRTYPVASTSRQKSRSSSPVSLTYQQKEQKINMILSQINESKTSRPLTSAKSLCNSSLQNRYRGLSTGSGTNDNSVVLSNQQSLNSNAYLRVKNLDPNMEEKLSKTGNIFEKRDDWSILYKLPICKQNTLHIRVEDEGPYGNDEIRCFVLSHFSSLGIKQIKCIFCSCNLTIYDRFPLIDGTLFVSPYNYNKDISIPTYISNKQQFMYAICLKCLNGEHDHEIKCKHCRKSWQNSGGSSLQIGTLYKYDLFAAFPCCQNRLNCTRCDKSLIDVESAHMQYFSSFSEEKECPSCKTKSLHFIKPLDEIYLKPSCESSTQ